VRVDFQRAGSFEIARFWGGRAWNLAISFSGFPFCRESDFVVASEGTMRPKQHEVTGSSDLFRARLDQIINLKHELVQLAAKIDWQWIDREIAPLYGDKGRPGIETRFVIGLLLLKHIYGLSDEGVCERWVYDPYFQHFTGEEFFQHEFPHERSDLTHWRKRLSDKLELLLAESLRVAHQSGALPTRDLARVTIDTTVQPQAISFPTDAKLRHAAIKGLNRLAAKHGVRLRQSYLRIAKHAAMMAGRYARAKQFKRHHRELRLLRSRLGRIIRDIGRKIAGNTDLEAIFTWPLTRAAQIRGQQQRQRGWKLYPFHAPEVECIGKGKASAPYEFGVKTSIVTTNARAPGGEFVLYTKTPAIPTTVIPSKLSSKTPRNSPAALSSAPLSTRDTAAMMWKTCTASLSRARSVPPRAAF
jgi:transposase, IS5 family